MLAQHRVPPGGLSAFAYYIVAKDLASNDNSPSFQPTSAMN